MCEKYRLLLFNGNEWEKIDSYETSKEGKEAAKSGTVGNAYILCDRNNGNIHMRPLNKEFANQCSTYIDGKLNKIKESIEEFSKNKSSSKSVSIRNIQRAKTLKDRNVIMRQHIFLIIYHIKPVKIHIR